MFDPAPVLEQLKEGPRTRLVSNAPKSVFSVLATVTVIGTRKAKVACTALSSVIETVHVELDPEQAPDQPVKDVCGAGLAVRVTDPEAKPDVQVAPQLIPDGLLETVPNPLLVTVSV